MLRLTAQTSGDFKTRYSLVLDPIAREVYIAVERDYDHIWKASLDSKTIETFAGFSKRKILPLDDEGVVGPILQSFADVNENQASIPYFLILGGILAIAAAVLLLRLL